MDLTANWTQPKKELVNFKTGKQQLFTLKHRKKQELKRKLRKGERNKEQISEICMTMSSYLTYIHVLDGQRENREEER